MRPAVLCSAIALMLSSSGYALAQEPSAAEAQKQSPPAQPQQHGNTTAPDGTIPPPPHAQPQAPIADQAKPAAVGPAQANTASTAPTTNNSPPGSTPQTTPSTISEANAKLDALLIVGLQFPLTDAQKQMIAKSVSSAPQNIDAKVATLHVADFLPFGTDAQDFALEVMNDIPAAKQYKFVKAAKRVLIVDAVNRIVVGEIGL